MPASIEQACPELLTGRRMGIDLHLVRGRGGHFVFVGRMQKQSIVRA